MSNVQESKEVVGIDWSDGRLLPAFQMPQHLDAYDLRGMPADIQLSVTTLAGLLNRPQPRVYLINNNDDDFWLKEAFGSIAQSRPAINGGDILGTMLTMYPGCVKGIIIYDPDFLDSINIATTLAGQREGIVVSPAQAQTLQQAPHHLSLIDDLRTYKWRSRLQAYTWAQHNLLAGSSRHLVAGLDPKVTSGLRSFLVAANAFVYWLDPRDLLPHPTQEWDSERGLMKQIFDAFPSGIIHLGWFIDEGSGVSLTSHSAKLVLASDYFYNLETWTSVPAAGPLSRPQPVQAQTIIPPSPSSPDSADNKADIYVSFTISDGDNLQYVQHRMLHLWNDSARGSVPIGWTLPPALAQAAPKLAEYYTRTATAHDELLAGPSGAGYMFPSHWPTEHLPWFLQLTSKLMANMGMTTLQVLDVDSLQGMGLSFLAWLGGGGMEFRDTTLHQTFTQALAPVGLLGLLSGAAGHRPTVASYNGLPVYQNLGLANSVNKAASLIRNAVLGNTQRPLFLNVYILAWNMTPSDIKQVVGQLGEEYTVVTPGTLLRLIAAN